MTKRLKPDTQKNCLTATHHRWPNATEQVAGCSGIRTDGWLKYENLPANTHEAKVVSGSKAHEILHGVHQVFSNLKRWAKGVFHGLRKCHLQRYLDAFVVRWNRRRHTRSAFDTLLGIGIGLGPATYRDFVEQRA